MSQKVLFNYFDSGLRKFYVCFEHSWRSLLKNWIMKPSFVFSPNIYRNNCFIVQKTRKKIADWFFDLSMNKVSHEMSKMNIHWSRFYIWFGFCFFFALSVICCHKKSCWCRKTLNQPLEKNSNFCECCCFHLFVLIDYKII